MNDWKRFEFCIAVISQIDVGTAGLFVGHKDSIEGTVTLREVLRDYADRLAAEKPEFTVKAKIAANPPSTKSTENRAMVGERLREARAKNMRVPDGKMPQGVEPMDLVKAGIGRSTAYTYAQGKFPMRIKTIEKIEAALQEIVRSKGKPPSHEKEKRGNERQPGLRTRRAGTKGNNP